MAVIAIMMRAITVGQKRGLNSVMGKWAHHRGNLQGAAGRRAMRRPALRMRQPAAGGIGLIGVPCDMPPQK